MKQEFLGKIKKACPYNSCYLLRLLLGFEPSTLQMRDSRLSSYIKIFQVLHLLLGYLDYLFQLKFNIFF